MADADSQHVDRTGRVSSAGQFDQQSPAETPPTPQLHHAAMVQDISVLYALLADRSADIWSRSAAAQGLGLLRDRAAVPALRKALENVKTIDLFTASVIQALSLIGTPDGTSSLCAVIQDPQANYGLKSAAAYALGELGDFAASPTLQSLAQDQFAIRMVREAAIVAMGKMRDVEAVSILANILGSAGEPYLIRSAVAQALGNIGSVSATPSLKATLIRTDVNGWTMGCAHERLRVFAAESLGEIGDPTAVPELCGVMLDPNVWDALRISAAKALGRIRSEEAVPALAEALSQRNARQSIRYLVAEALGNIASHQAIQSLNKAAEEPWRTRLEREKLAAVLIETAMHDG